MDQTPPALLPAMSYTGVEAKPLARPAPTEAQIRERAHEIWLRRGGAPGNPTLDWLEAELELTAELRSGKPVKPRVVAGRATVASPVASQIASQVEPRPEAPKPFARGDAQWNIPRTAA